MEQRRLGNSGLVVSAIGLGCNNLGRPGTFTESAAGAQAVVDAADVHGAPCRDTPHEPAAGTGQALLTFASERGLSMVELALGWLAAQPAVGSVIAGATSTDQVRGNAAVTWRPTSADMATLDDICPPGRR